MKSFFHFLQRFLYIEDHNKWFTAISKDEELREESSQENNSLINSFGAWD